MIFYHKNSFLASLVSIFGSLFIIAGIAAFAEGEILPGIGSILLSLPFLGLAQWIADNKAFKKWWKQITDNHLEPHIAASVDYAIAIYKKNPQKRTIEAIRKLNPYAADEIERNHVAKKKK